MGTSPHDFFSDIDRDGLEKLAKIAKASVVSTAFFIRRFDLLQGNDELLKAMDYPIEGSRLFKKFVAELMDFDQAKKIPLLFPRNGSRRIACLRKAIELAQTEDEVDSLWDFPECRNGKLYELRLLRKLEMRGKPKPPP